MQLWGGGGSHPNLLFDSAERRGFPEPTRPGAEARRKRVEVRAEKRRQTGKYSPALHEEGHFSLCGDISAQSVRCRHALQQPPQPPRPQGSRRIAAACFEGTNQKAERGRVRRPRPRAAPGARDLRARLSQRGRRALRQLSRDLPGHASLFTERPCGVSQSLSSHLTCRRQQQSVLLVPTG